MVNVVSLTKFQHCVEARILLLFTFCVPCITSDFNLEDSYNLKSRRVFKTVHMVLN